MAHGSRLMARVSWLAAQVIGFCGSWLAAQFIGVRVQSN